MFMQAATFVRPFEVAIRAVKTPTPGPTQVRIALEGTGVCASNLPLWEGAPWFAYPLPPGAGGHEGWGVIEAVGNDVDPACIGQRVAALSFHAYAERDLAEVSQVVQLPPALTGKPFPGEALGCAMNIFRRSGIGPDHQVAIVGIGFLGALLTRLAARAGARVIAISRRACALDVARSMGASETIAMDDHGTIVARVESLTQGRMCDCAIEAVGKQGPLDLASELLREGGRLVIAGYHQDGPRYVNMQRWNVRALELVNAHERDPAVVLWGMREALRAVAEGWLDPAPLYTHTFALSGLGDALRATRDRPEGFMKALVSCGVKS